MVQLGMCTICQMCTKSGFDKNQIRGGGLLWPESHKARGVQKSMRRIFESVLQKA